MRTNEERIAAMHRRAGELRRAQRRKQVLLIQSATAAVSFAAVLLLAVFVPEVSGGTLPEPAPGTMNASIFFGNHVSAMIVIAVLSFLLGVALTVFCFRLKKWQDRKEREDETS